jgi:hypothetical protein
MIIPIIKHFKDLSYQEYLKSLKEAEIAADPEVLEIEEAIEECPICEEEKELRDYISSAVITRSIKKIIIHCTGTSPKATISAILKHWKEKLKWNNPGYHIIYPETGFTVLLDFNGISAKAVVSILSN